MNNVHQHPSSAQAAAEASFTYLVRSAEPNDAEAIDALVRAHQEEGHLLPRQVDEIRARAHHFTVAEVNGTIKACAELVALSTRMAEVRSLVVAPDARHHGLATRILDELRARAVTEGFQSLLALAHDPRLFIRHDFSIVPHEWLTEKVARDCRACALFRQCGQYAMLLPLAPRMRDDAPRVARHPAAAVA
jgi:amino-acid N-acetyltransferase